MRLHVPLRFHRSKADLCKRLRYLLGGYRPSQTTHQLLSPATASIAKKFKERAPEPERAEEQELFRDL